MTSTRLSTDHPGFTVITKVSIPMVSELVSPLTDEANSTHHTAFIILPQNGTGRGDNTTWDDEYTLVVSDWYVKGFDVC